MPKSQTEFQEPLLSESDLQTDSVLSSNKRNNEAKNFRMGIFFTLLAGMGFGFLGIFGKLAFARNIGVGDLLFFRFAMATGGLFLIRYVFSKQILNRTSLSTSLITSINTSLGTSISKKSIVKHNTLSKRQKWNSILLGCFGYAVFSTLYFFSIKNLSVALAALILFSFPIFVNLGSVFYLKEKFSVQQGLALALSVFGLTVLLWGDFQVHSWLGVVCGFAAAVTYSAYVLVSGRTQQGANPLEATQYVLLGAAVSLFIIHGLFIKDSLHMDQWLRFPLEHYLIFFAMSVFSTILPIVFFLMALHRLPSSVASVVVTVEPLVATLSAWLLLNEALDTKTFVGGTLIVSSVMISAVRKKAVHSSLVS